MREYLEMVITPEIAKDWLDNKNPHNRNISFARVRAYADDINSGNWDITAEGIAFDTDGNLMNGQHRLAAVIMCDKPITALVCFNMPKSLNYDNGKKRTMSDNIKMATGEYVSNSVTSACSLAVKILRKNGSIYCSNNTVYDWLKAHYHSFEEIEMLTVKDKLVSSAHVVLAMVTALESGVPAEQIIQWRKTVSNGMYNYPYQETAIRFRNWMIKNAKYLRGGTARQELLRTAQANISHYASKELVSAIRIPKELVYQVKP